MAGFMSQPQRFGDPAPEIGYFAHHGGHEGHSICDPPLSTDPHQEHHHPHDSEDHPDHDHGHHHHPDHGEHPDHDCGHHQNHEPHHDHDPGHHHDHGDHHGHAHAHGRPKPKKPGILLAAFGVAIPEARGGLCAVEAAVREAYPGCAVEWAFTAHKVRRKMKRRGFHAVSVAEALSHLYDEGVTHLAVQSLHTVPGVEYHWTRDQAEVYRHPRKGFLEVQMGGPLLESEGDLQRTRAALADYIPAERKPEEAVVLVGHGTYHAGHQRYLDFQECVRHTDPQVFVGALMGKPGCGEILEFLQAAGAERVWLLPFMSVAGHHVRVDIYGDHPRSWKNRLTAAGFSVETRLTGTLEHPGFREIWLDHLRKAAAAVMG